MNLWGTINYVTCFQACDEIANEKNILLTFSIFSIMCCWFSLFLYSHTIWLYRRTDWHCLLVVIIAHFSKDLGVYLRIDNISSRIIMIGLIALSISLQLLSLLLFSDNNIYSIDVTHSDCVNSYEEVVAKTNQICCNLVTRQYNSIMKLFVQSISYLLSRYD